MPPAHQFLPPSQFDLKNLDRLLPSQPVMRQFFKGPEEEFYPRLEAITTAVLPIKSVHQKWDIRVKQGISYETLGSDLSGLHLLQLLIRMAGFRRVLEIGTYIGVSALFLAEAVGPHGRVVTIEVGAEFAEIARDNFERNGMGDRIELILGDVNDALPSLRGRPESFDLIFLDGDKASYGRLLQPLLGCLRPAGAMLVDDVFCNGDTLNLEPTTERGRGARDLLTQVAKLSAYQRVVLPYGNGQLLLLKPGQ